MPHLDPYALSNPVYVMQESSIIITKAWRTVTMIKRSALRKCHEAADLWKTRMEAAVVSLEQRED